MNKLKLLSVSSLAFMTLAVPASASTDVKIETKATQMNITVPTSIEFIFNEDGTNTLPTNFDITNNSQIAGVSLVKVEMNALTSGWRLLPASADTKTLAVDQKDIQFYMGLANQEKLVSSGNSASTSGSASWDNGELAIEASQSQNISFNVQRGAFNTSESSAKAFDMILSFEFNQ